MTYYKIRSKKSGLYSKGISNMVVYCSEGDPSGGYWSKTGKIWPNLGTLRTHFNSVLKHGRGLPDWWEIIEYEVVEKSIKEPIDWIDPKKIIKILSK